MPGIASRQTLPVSLIGVKDAILEAGEIIRRWYGSPVPVTLKGDGSPVTPADVETNAFLRHRLTQLLPDAGWLSEESKDDLARCSKEWVWVVDPLDGTKEFSRRIPEVATSIGLVRADTVVLGAVYNPLTGEGAISQLDKECEFWGIQGSSHPCSLPSEAVACVSRSEIQDGSAGPYLELFSQVRPIGSAAYKLLRVAAGIEDLMLSVQPKSEWDVCGGVALLQSAGMVYHRLDSDPVRFNRRNPRILSGAVAGEEPLAREAARLCRAVSPLLWHSPTATAISRRVDLQADAEQHRDQKQRGERLR